MDESGVSEGFEIGETVTLVASGTELEVVGYVEDVRYAVMATAYSSFEDWAAILRIGVPGGAVCSAIDGRRANRSG